MSNAADAPRRVLMVSYWYPPSPGAGAQRVAGFARHLPVSGWTPCVLTAGPPTGSLPRALWTGRAAETDEAGVRVIRVPDAFAPEAVFADYAGPPPARPGRNWLRHWLFPDRYLIWRRRATRLGRERLRSQPVDAIWTTFPPASAVLVALELARVSRRPLIVDFRDNWIGPGGYEPDDARLLERHRRLEAAAVRAARAMVAVSDAMARGLAKRHDVGAERFTVIPNGFDLSRYGPLEPGPRPGTDEPPPAGGRPTLVHVGSVSHRNRPDAFLAALQAIGPEALPCRVRFVGNLSAAYVASLGLAGAVETTGVVSAEQAWRETCAADGLLLLVGEYVACWGHNTKLFEYLRSGRPILCVDEAAGSNDAALLRWLAPRRVAYARLHDADSIRAGMNALAELTKRYATRTLDDEPALAAFDRRRLAAGLAAVLNRATNEPAAAGDD